MTARTIPMPEMTTRRLMMALTAIVLIVALLVGASGDLRTSLVSGGLPTSTKLSLDNVRSFAAAPTAESQSYAVDGGLLYAGRPLDWKLIPLPEGVIANAVALGDRSPNAVYVGAGNELALYRTVDEGETWLRVPLSDQYIGAVTSIAVDGENRLVYVGTDTAGVFRMRDVGSSVTANGHFMVDEPVVEVAADSTGAGLAFFRTAKDLYRSENGGLAWSRVTTLSSVPTALVIANQRPPVVYVGTSERGVLKSSTGIAWMGANDGLNVVPGTRVSVDALSVDPQRPDVLYAATSYVYGSTETHVTPAGVYMSRGAIGWAPIARSLDTQVAELLPVAGQTGAVYALMSNSRTPLALGMAPTSPVLARSDAGSEGLAANMGSLVALAAAAMAAVWLAVLIAAELRQRKFSLRQGKPATVVVSSK